MRCLLLICAALGVLAVNGAKRVQAQYGWVGPPAPQYDPFGGPPAPIFDPFAGPPAPRPELFLPPAPPPSPSFFPPPTYFPPAPMPDPYGSGFATPPAPSTAPNQSGLGITYANVPGRGLEITHIRAYSKADRLGLVPGDMIVRANGVNLAAPLGIFTANLSQIFLTNRTLLLEIRRTNGQVIRISTRTR